MLGLYISNIPEAEDMLSMKHGAMRNSSFHNCLISRGDIQRCNSFRRRTLFRMNMLFAMLHTNSSNYLNVSGELTQTLCYRFYLFFLTFLLGVYECVDVCSISRTYALSFVGCVQTTYRNLQYYARTSIIALDDLNKSQRSI